jgi:hypothetical protein
MKYMLLVVLLVLTAVVARSYGPTDAITIPLSGENRFWGIFIKDIIFWINMALALVVAVDYVWIRYVVLQGRTP